MAPSPVSIRGDNLDGVRRRNLSTVLRQVHATGGVSRAELTRHTGLNRSTIAALVAELVALGWVTEADPQQTSGVGRPSLVIRPAEEPVAIAVNPELDAVTIGVVGLGGRMHRRVRYDNERVPTAREVVNIVAAVLAGMRAELTGLRPVGIGVAVPGLVDGDGAIELAPHLGWRGEPISTMLAEATGFRTVAANDASLGAIAERTFGVGLGVDQLVYLNGGASGIGGGVVADGTLLRGAGGYAGEFGHTLVNSVGITCHCGATGCLETEVTRQRLLDALGLDRSAVERLDERLVAAYRGAGADPAVVAEVQRQVDFLVVALRNAVNVLNPEVIVLGGFLGSLLEVARDRIEDGLRGSALVGARDGVRLERAGLGADILMVGAAELAFDDVIADPAAIAELSAAPRSATA